MNNSELIQNKSDKVNNVLLIIVLYLIASFSLYYAFNNLVGVVTDEFVSLFKLLPKIILYTLPMFYVIFFFRNMFYKKFSKAGAIVFISITTFILVASLVLFFMESSYHFSNLIYSYYEAFTPIDVLLIALILLGVNLIILIKVCKGDFQKKSTIGYCYGPFAVKSVLRMIVLAVLCFLLGVFLIEGLVGLTFTQYIKYETLKYLATLLWIVLPFVGFAFYAALDFNRKSSFILFIIFGSLTVIYCGFFEYLLIVVDDFLSLVGQPFFILTFASSMPIGSIVLVLINLFLLFEIIFSSFKYKKILKNKN